MFGFMVNLAHCLVVTLFAIWSLFTQDGWVSTFPVWLFLRVSDTFLNAPASPEVDEENEIYGSSREDWQFISDLWGQVFPRDQKGSMIQIS